MQKRCYYEVLGVKREADHGEIKKAFKRLAKECHPDLHPGKKDAEERFKEVAEAHEVLTDPEKRELYDRFGHDGPRNAGFSGFSGVGMDDLLSHFAQAFGFGFGGGGGRRGPQQHPGDDIHTVLQISFMEAARGAQKPLKLRRELLCTTCNGSGAKAGTQPVVCSTCNGRGQVVTQRGILTIGSECPSCRGRGRVIRERCEPCRGQGITEKEESITVSVPPGIDTGKTVRYSGKGQASPDGGPPGDLMVTYQVEPDTRFERDGDHLLTQVAISYTRAALGGCVKVPTLDGETDLDVPEGTQPGDITVLRGRGMPNVHGRGTGDLVVQFQVSVPKKLDGEQRKLIEELARFDDAQPACKESGGFAQFFRRKKK